MSYRSSVIFLSSSISPFCAWMLIYHFYFSRQSTSAPHGQHWCTLPWEKGCQWGSQAPRYNPDQGSYTPFTFHQHPHSSRAAAYTRLSVVGAVVNMHPGYLAWDERGEQTFGWLLGDRQHAEDLLYKGEKELSPVDISDYKSCQWQRESVSWDQKKYFQLSKSNWRTSEKCRRGQMAFWLPKPKSSTPLPQSTSREHKTGFQGPSTPEKPLFAA